MPAGVTPEKYDATQTSGIVVKVGSLWVALYANGRRHAGENLDELLKARSARSRRATESDHLKGSYEP
jgi:hypothetical protein